MAQVVFVPLDRGRARRLRDGAALADVTGHAASPSLLRAHGFDDSSLEDAEYAALGYAGVHAILSPSVDPLRLVLACDVTPSQLEVDGQDPYGQVTVRLLHWGDVRALFADEPEARPAIDTARRAAAGRVLGEALDLPGIEALLDEHDLLWFTPQELDALP